MKSTDIFKHLISRENTNVVYEIVSDIFEKKSNFNLDRNVGKKYVYTFIHSKAKNAAATFIPPLVKKYKDLTKIIISLNKYVVEDVVRELSSSQEYKNFINAISVTPNNKDRNIINPGEKMEIQSLAPPVNKKLIPHDSMNSVVEDMKSQRYTQQPVPTPEFTEPVEEEKLNLEYAMDQYNKQRDLSNTEPINKIGNPEEINVELGDLESMLFSSPGEENNELPYQPRGSENDEPEIHQETHHNDSFKDYVNDTIEMFHTNLERLYIIRDYINTL